MVSPSAGLRRLVREHHDREPKGSAKPAPTRLKTLFAKIPILRTIFQVVTTIVLSAVGLSFLAPAIASAITTGLSGGKLGDTLKSAAISFATALAFNAVGTMTLGQAHAAALPDSPNYYTNVAGHAAVGCLSSAASGGSCKDGALSGAVGAATAPLTGGMFPNAKNDPGQSAGALITASVFGGLASVAGGGKFENGAVTAAFGYMYNACGGPNRCALFGGAVGFGAGVVASGGCDWVTSGACAVANPTIVSQFIAGFAALGSAIDILFSDSAPTDAPSGTRPIDKWGIGRGDIHDIKDGIGAGPADWVGVTPDGNIITTGADGKSVDNGHVDDYTNKIIKKFPHPE